MSGGDSRPFVVEWRRAVRDSALTSTQKLVALVLSLWMDKRGASCFPSTKTVAAGCSLTERTIIKTRRELVAAGFLDGQKRAGKTTIYSARLPEGVNVVHPFDATEGCTSFTSGLNLIHPRGDGASADLVIDRANLPGDVADEFERIVAPIGPAYPKQRELWLRAYLEDAAGFEACVRDALRDGERPAALLTAMVGSEIHRRTAGSRLLNRHGECAHPECGYQDRCLREDAA